ncbi:MAG: hypothetical protein HQM09_03800 [Candidatus Riflebacteria bacterium]|nr:hypothetical protein [Candidatus Riflebacteria bacterium]
MNLCKGILFTSLAVFTAFSPVMAEDPAGDQTIVASDPAIVVKPPVVIPPDQDAGKLAPVKIFVTIDGKLADGGIVEIIDNVADSSGAFEHDGFVVASGTAKTTLRKDHNYLIKYTEGDLKFKSDGPVFLGETTEAARINIAYNTKAKKWAFDWKKFGDNEKCSLYIDIKRSNGSVPQDYHITLLDDRRVVLRDVWFGKDGKFSFLLPKPDKGEKADVYFALLTSNHGPDFRYKFAVGVESNRIRHELVIPAVKAPVATGTPIIGSATPDVKNAKPASGGID